MSGGPEKPPRKEDFLMDPFEVDRVGTEMSFYQEPVRYLEGYHATLLEEELHPYQEFLKIVEEIDKRAAERPPQITNEKLDAYFTSGLNTVEGAEQLMSIMKELGFTRSLSAGYADWLVEFGDGEAEELQRYAVNVTQAVERVYGEESDES